MIFRFPIREKQKSEARGIISNMLHSYGAQDDVFENPYITPVVKG